MNMTELKALILAAVPTAHDDCQTAADIAAALGLPTPQVATHLGNLRRKGLVDSLDNTPGDARTWHRFDSAWFRHIAATPRTSAPDDNLTATECADMADALAAAETAAPSNRQAQALTWEGPRVLAIPRPDIDFHFHTDSPHHLNILAIQEADNETFWRAADLLRNAIGQTTGHTRRGRYEQRIRDYEINARRIDAGQSVTPFSTPGRAAEVAADIGAAARASLNATTDALDAEAAQTEAARVLDWQAERVAWAESCGDNRLCFFVTGRHVAKRFRPADWPVIVTRDGGTTPPTFYADGPPYGCGKHQATPWRAIADLLGDNAVKLDRISVAPGQDESAFWKASGYPASPAEAVNLGPLPTLAAQGQVAPRGPEVLANGAEVLESFPSPESSWPEARVVLCDTRGQAGHRFATWWQNRPGSDGTVWGHYFNDLAEARADAIRRAARMTTESDSAEAAEALRLAQAEADHATTGAEMAREMTELHPDDIGYRDELRIADEYATAAALVARVLGRYVSAAQATADTGAEAEAWAKARHPDRIRLAARPAPERSEA